MWIVEYACEEQYFDFHCIVAMIFIFCNIE